MTSNIIIHPTQKTQRLVPGWHRHLVFCVACFLLMMGICQQPRGQTPKTQIQLRVLTLDSITPDIRELFQHHEKGTHRTLGAAETAASNLMTALHRKGHLLASVDSARIKNDTMFLFVWCGIRFRAARLVMEDDDAALAELLGIHLHPQIVAQLPDKTIRALSDAFLRQGYPLATVTLTGMEIKGETLLTYAAIERGGYYVWDSLGITGLADIHNKVLQRLLRIREGKPYNNLLINDLEKNIASLPFVSLPNGYSIVLTTDGKARVILPLEKVKASGFNGLIGFGPDRADPTKLILSGDVALKLHNALGYAEEMELKWNGIQGDQNLFMFYRQPYLPFASFGVMGRFELFRKGETYYTLLQRAGLVVRPTPESLFTVWLQRRGSRVLDRTIFSTATTLPPFADFEATLFGITWQREQLDLPANPGRGYQIEGEIGGGARRLLTSADIPVALFQGIEIKTRHAAAQINAGTYLALTPRWIIRSAIAMATLYGGTQHENGLYFIGGIRTLRGFDERSITASSYALGSVELRYRFEQTAHFKLFIDGGWYEKALADSYQHDTPYGFGVGMSLPSPAGMMQVSYGWGIGFGNRFDVRTGRLHVGIEARF
jgi:outer membrane protein assembly factor BamA